MLGERTCLRFDITRKPVLCVFNSNQQNGRNPREDSNAAAFQRNNEQQ